MADLYSCLQGPNCGAAQIDPRRFLQKAAGLKTSHINEDPIRQKVEEAGVLVCQDFPKGNNNVPDSHENNMQPFKIYHDSAHCSPLSLQLILIYSQLMLNVGLQQMRMVVLEIDQC